MISGEKELLEEIKKLSGYDMHRNVSQAIKLVQAEAKELCPVAHGELRNGIYTKVEHDDDCTRGICYTNVAHGVYVEFGTGPTGQEDHEGISPEVAVAYSQEPWWIHESQVEKAAAEKYGWFHIDTPDGRFYLCAGQAAQPFMYPAICNKEDEILKIMARSIK